MKHCAGCKQDLPLDQFGTHRVGRKAGKPISRCKECRSTEARSWMKSSAGAPALLARKRYRRRDRARAWLEAQKNAPCTDCGGTFHPCAMHFDHVRGVKRGGVTALASQGDSLENLKAEIAKCELVCACCHAVRTYTRKQYQTSVRKYPGRERTDPLR